MLIAVINQSSLVKDSDIQLMVGAIQIQLDLHCAPAWNQKSIPIRFYSNAASVPGYAWTIYIIDNDAQVAGALGFHEEETNGKIDGYIMCQPILSNGGDVLKFDAANPGKYTISATLSHEVLETFLDRFTNVFCDNGTTSWCQEMCDAVEQIGYGIMVNGTNVSVSDFVFPNFFNQYAVVPRNAPLNFLNTLKAPFTILPGGYAIQRTGGPGTETQVFGELMPQWRRDMKKHDLARFNRRAK
jgi:hypothetical protein